MQVVQLRPTCTGGSPCAILSYSREMSSGLPLRNSGIKILVGLYWVLLGEVVRVEKGEGGGKRGRENNILMGINKVNLIRNVLFWLCNFEQIWLFLYSHRNIHHFRNYNQIKLCSIYLHFSFLKIGGYGVQSS